MFEFCGALNRRRLIVAAAIRIGLLSAMAALVPTCLLWSSASRAQEPFEAFFPLFVELPGWKGDKPFGSTRKVAPAGITVTAGRAYQRGDATLLVSMGAMPMKPRLVQPPTTGTVETKERRVSLSIIDGWQVASASDFEDNAVGVHVTLANGYLNLSTHGVAERDLVTLARRFDWKALQALISTFEVAN